MGRFRPGQYCDVVDDHGWGHWAFDEVERKTVGNFTLGAVRRVAYATFGSRSKPGLLERVSSLEALNSRVEDQEKRLKMLERLLDGLCVEDVVSGLERLDSIENIVGSRSKRLDKLETDGDKVQKGILMLGGKIDDLDKSLSKFVHQHGQRTADQDALSYGQLLSKVVRLETVVNNNAMFTQSSLDDLAAKTRETREHTQSSLDDLAARTRETHEHVFMEYPSYSDRLTLLERNMESMNCRTLESRCDALYKEMDAKLESFRTKLHERVEDIAQSVEYSMGKLGLELASVRENLGILDEQPNRKLRIDCLTEKLTCYEGKVEGLAKRVGDLAGEVHRVDVNMQVMDRKTQGLHKHVDDENVVLVKHLKILKSDVQNLANANARLDDLDAKLAAMSAMERIEVQVKSQVVETDGTCSMTVDELVQSKLVTIVPQVVGSISPLIDNVVKQVGEFQSALQVVAERIKALEAAVSFE